MNIAKIVSRKETIKSKQYSFCNFQFHNSMQKCRWIDRQNVYLLPHLLCLLFIIILFILSSMMEGRTRGTATQNRASWGSSRAPESVFLLWPCRNFRLPWNCMFYRRQEQIKTRQTQSTYCVEMYAWEGLSLIIRASQP